MTVDEFMHTLPFIYTHGDFVFFLVWIIASAIIFIYARIETYMIDTSDFIGSVVGSVFVGGIISLFINVGWTIATPITTSQVNYARGTHTKVISTKSYDLSGATSSGFTDQSVQGNVFYVSGSSTDTTSYRFVIKDSPGNYQIRTLTDMFGKINKNDIYINQSKDNKPHLQVDTHKYTDKRMAKLIDDNSSYSSKWKTYTFYVPDNSITSKFSFK